MKQCCMEEKDQTLGGEELSYLIVTLDSCRWDAYQDADTRPLDRFGLARLAYAQATFTYPAHLAIYRGYTPCSHDGDPYFDRRTEPLFRIAAPSHRQHRRDAMVLFPEGTPSIVEGFAALGHRTFGVGAMGWFEDPDLRDPFQRFVYTGIDITRQRRLLEEWIEEDEGPFFALWNVGETHEPYEFGGPITPRRILTNAKPEDTPALLAKQAAACSYAVSEIALLLQRLSSRLAPTVCMVTADHGECLGEDDLWGHAIYHPKIMHVPLAIFTVGGPCP